MGATLLPTHRLILSMWEVVMEEARAEHGPREQTILVAPCDGLGADMIAGMSLKETPTVQVIDNIEQAKASGFLADPCLWLAMAAPCFIKPNDRMEEAIDGDLRQQYIDGDESIREAVAVFIATQGLPSHVMPRVTFRVYVQPFLGATSEQPMPVERGYLADALLAGLDCANSR